MPWMNASDFFEEVEYARELDLGPVDPRDNIWFSDFKDDSRIVLEDFGEERTPGICINCGKMTGKAPQAKRCEPCRKRYHNWAKAKSQAKTYWGNKGTTS